MTNQQIIDFIKTQLEKGINKETISKELLANGWTIEDVNESFKAIETPAINQVNNLNMATVQAKNNSNKTILVIVISLLLIATAVFGAYYLSTKTKFQITTSGLDSKSQNTLPNPYVNDEYHFSFSYPKDIVSSVGKVSEFNLSKIDFAYNIYVQNKTTGSVESTQLPLGGMIVGKKTYQQFVDSFKKSKTLNNITEKKIEKNGLVWNTVSVIDADNSPAMNIAITERDGLNYTLVLLGTPLVNGKEVISGQNDMLNSTMEMFIDTFKFTDIKQ